MSPANIEVRAAMKNDIITPGPATSFATIPGMIYTPTPRVQPIYDKEIIDLN